MSKELIGSHSVHETLVRQTQIDAARIEELERDLLNLVCRIHRDGGHYIAKYGEAKAIADADTVAAQNNADLDALQADNARLREALVKHVAPYLGHKEVYDEVLASIPAQSLARLRNRVLDEAINVAWNNEPDCNGPIEMALRKLKEPEWTSMN